MSAEIEAVYLAVEHTYGPAGDLVAIDEVVFFAQREAEQRVHELGSGWSVVKLYVEGEAAQHATATSGVDLR